MSSSATKSSRRGPWVVGKEPAYVYEGEKDDVVKIGDQVHLATLGAWGRRQDELMSRFGINSVALDDLTLGKRKSLDFLLDFPPLRGLTVSLHSVRDLTAISRMTELRTLTLSLRGWKLGDGFRPVDFSPLRKLTALRMTFCPAFSSALSRPSVRQLKIADNGERIHRLDLTALRRLSELTLDHCPKLERVDLHPRAKVEALDVALCGSYRIDWARLGPDLLFFRTGGRLSFPLDDLARAAPRLRVLMLSEIRLLPPLSFLGRMKDLHTVSLFSASKLKLPKQDEATLRRINARGGHGPNAFVGPPLRW